MNLINNLMPSNFNKEDFEKKKSKIEACPRLKTEDIPTTSRL